MRERARLFFKSFSARLYRTSVFLAGLSPLHKKALRLIELEKGESLLDVGCGTGRLLHLLRGKYGEAVSLAGVDKSPEMLAGVPEEDRRAVKIKIAPADDLPFSGASFDWVVSTLVLHHLSREEQERMLGECARVLRPGGVLYLADLGRPDGIRGRFFAWFLRSHARAKENLAGIEEMLEGAGFALAFSEKQFGFIEHILARNKHRGGGVPHRHAASGALSE